MKNTIKQKMAAVAMAGLVTVTQVDAAGDFEAGVGYMESAERAFGFIKGQGVVYQDEVASHKIGLEYIGYDETLDSSANTDLLFTTIVLNYEVEYQMNPAFSVYGGVGIGGQLVSLESPVGDLDDDLYGYAQVFAGVRARLSDSIDFKLGVRRMFFDEYELLGISGIKQEQTWGFEAGFTLRF